MDDVRIIMGQSNTMLQESLMISAKQEAPEDFPAGRDGSKSLSASCDFRRRR